MRHFTCTGTVNYDAYIHCTARRRRGKVGGPNYHHEEEASNQWGGQVFGSHMLQITETKEGKTRWYTLYKGTMSGKHPQAVPDLKDYRVMIIRVSEKYSGMVWVLCGFPPQQIET